MSNELSSNDPCHQRNVTSDGINGTFQSFDDLFTTNHDPHDAPKLIVRHTSFLLPHFPEKRCIRGTQEHPAFNSTIPHRFPVSIPKKIHQTSVANLVEAIMTLICLQSYSATTSEFPKEAPQNFTKQSKKAFLGFLGDIIKQRGDAKLPPDSEKNISNA